jgi:hypothetical protein
MIAAIVGIGFNGGALRWVPTLGFGAVASSSSSASSGSSSSSSSSSVTPPPPGIPTRNLLGVGL